MKPFYFFLLLLLLALTDLTAQADLWSPRPGFSITAAGGLSANGDSRVDNRAAFQLGLEYAIPFADKWSFVYGAGGQYRSVRYVTQERVPCDFPIGNKATVFTDSEFYELQQLEINARVGVRYRAGRFSLGLAALPTWLANDRIRYRFLRTFISPNRPNTDIDEILTSGDEFLNFAGISPSSRIRYTKNFNLQASVSVEYNLTERLAVGLVVQPMLTTTGLESYENIACGFAGCDVVQLTAPVFDARVTTGMLRIRYGL